MTVPQQSTATVELSDGTVRLTGWQLTEMAPDYYGISYMQLSGWLPEGYAPSSIACGTNHMVHADLPGRYAYAHNVNVQVEVKGYGHGRSFMKIQWRGSYDAARDASRTAAAGREKDTPGLTEPATGAASTPTASVGAVRTELLRALALAGREHPAALRLRAAFDELGEVALCEGPKDEIGHLVDAICALAHLDPAPGPAPADTAGEGLTVYRAAHDVIPVGLYLTPAEAQRHCEALVIAEHPAAVGVSFDWIGDDSDPEEPWELVAEIDGGPEQPTGCVVTPLRVDAVYDPEADS